MRFKALPLILIAAVAAVLFAGWRSLQGDTGQQRYKTQAVDRGDIVQTISANGTLNPVILVNVGTQISGTVLKLHADFNQRVSAGQVLAELDPALINAQILQDEANLLNAQANLKGMRIKEERSRALLEKNFITQSQLDDAVQAREAAQAQVEAARAQVTRDRTNLRYSVIRSPISGVVVARSVDLGQTVAASFQTPTLFQIAQDLTQMQIDTSIAEADIGGIEVGRKVEFGVDAFPDQPFEGVVRQLRLNPTIQQNVVTYDVVVAVDNAEEKLKPGMTAHVKIFAQRRDNVLRAPNAALRFRPEDGEKFKTGGGPLVFRVVNNELAPLRVKTGAADANFTEVISAELKPGDVLATGEILHKEKSGGFKLRLF
ncbi:MAG: efflux RND transporter periplasmic adaptor subunit [Burkholderiales bacterium]